MQGKSNLSELSLQVMYTTFIFYHLRLTLQRKLVIIYLPLILQQAYFQFIVLFT